MSVWSRLTGADKRQELAEQRKLRNDLYRQRLETRQKTADAYSRLFEAEVQRLHVGGDQNPQLAESGLAMGNPWWQDLAGLSLNDAWLRGFPTSELAYGWDAGAVANDDAARWHVMRVSRVLYDLHPHAKGIIETAVGFICGSSGWQVEPTPHMPLPDASNVEPLSEGEEENADPLFVEPVGDGIVRVPTDRNLHDMADVDEEDGKLDARMPMDFRLAANLRDKWARFIRRGVIHPQLGWHQFWREAFRRTRRDGECFIYLGHNSDSGALSPRFWLPEDVVHPVGQHANHSKDAPVFDQDANGIRVDEDDPDTVIGYWYRPFQKRDIAPRLVPASRVMHIKFGVDSHIRRGIPQLFNIRRFLQNFDSWIEQSLHHQRVQSSVAILRKWENTTRSQVEQLIQNKEYRAHERQSPAGNSKTYRTHDILPVMDAPGGMTMEMASPRGNFVDSEILARRVLLAIAVGVQQSEAMVTADGSNGNYASTRITQIIPMRTFESEQGDWSETITQFYEKWVYSESAMGRIPPIQDESQLDANVTSDPLPPFEAEETGERVVALNQAGLIDKRTAQEMLGVDPEVVKDRLLEEEMEQKSSGPMEMADEEPDFDINEPMDEFGEEDDTEIPGENRFAQTVGNNGDGDRTEQV